MTSAISSRSTRLALSLLLAALPCVSALDPSPALGETPCVDGKLRYESGVDTYTEIKTPYCVGPDDFHLVSRDCHRDLKSCIATIRKIARQNSVPPVETPDSLGSPGFRKCRELGGRPRFSEFWHEGKWKKLVLCYFDSGKIVLDHDTLGEKFP